MQKQNPERPAPTGGPHTPPAAQLYHLEPPERQRTDEAKKPADQKRWQMVRRTLAHQIFISNVRTFSIVAGCMLVLFVLALYIARKTWQIKQDHSPPAEAAGPAAPAEPPARTMPTDAEDSKDGDAAVPQSPQLDTEAMRKAVFLARRGKVLDDAGEYAKAAERYRDALRVWPYLTSVWTSLGRVYLRLGDYRRAQRALERAAENNPNDPSILNDLGVAYLFQNRLRKARDFFTAARDMDSRFPDCHFNLALCHLAEGDLDSAEDSLREFLHIKTDDPRALKELAYIQARRNHYREAFETLRKAISQAPEWPALYFDAAAAAALMGHVEDAINYLEKAEPLSSPAAVYQIYQQPAFKEIRLTDLGADFEKDLAERARRLIARSEEKAAARVPDETRPISSVSTPIQQ